MDSSILLRMTMGFALPNGRVCFPSRMTYMNVFLAIKKEDSIKLPLFPLYIFFQNSHCP